MRAVGCDGCLTIPAVLVCRPARLYGDMGPEKPGITRVPIVPAVPFGKIICAGAICVAVAGWPAPSPAADLSVVPGARHVERVTTTVRFANWRDRCAYAGHYCLYAWKGYVYHYPFDDAPGRYASRYRRAY